MGGGGEHAGDDGVAHVEGQHGVHHEDDEEEEGHLQVEENSASQKPAPKCLLPGHRWAGLWLQRNSSEKAG